MYLFCLGYLVYADACAGWFVFKVALFAFAGMLCVGCVGWAAGVWFGVCLLVVCGFVVFGVGSCLKVGCWWLVFFAARGCLCGFGGAYFGVAS